MKYNIMLTVTVLALLMFLPILTSCEKELDFEYHDVPDQLVIEGYVDQDGADVTVRFTTPMDEPMDTVNLTDCTVILEDRTLGDVRRLAADSLGHYTDTIPGIPGHDYRLSVERDGKRYESSCLMQQPTEIKGMGFNWIQMPYDHVAVLQLQFSDASDKDDYYWIRIYRNGEPYSWMTSNDRNRKDGDVLVNVMTSRKDQDAEDEKSVLRDGDVVTALVMPVSMDMTLYLNALSNDSNGPRMFGGDFCLGFFLAAPVARESVVFHPDEIRDY